MYFISLFFVVVVVFFVFFFTTCIFQYKENNFPNASPVHCSQNVGC